jgi:predicted GNAT family N-acyltransferase
MIYRLHGQEYRIQPLSADHDRGGFACGVPALDSYLQRQARQDVDRKLAAASILTTDGRTIAAFYTLSASSVYASELPEAYAKKLPRFPIPVTLLGRMAVSRSLQGLGLGEFLLTHAVASAVDASTRIASWAVVLDAKAGALAFYTRYGFLPLEHSTTRLFLPLSTARKAASPG